MSQHFSRKTTKSGEPAQIPSEILGFQPGGIEIEHQPVPFLARSTLYVSVLLFVSVVLWSCFAEVDKIVVTHGKIISRELDVMVQPMITSIVREIHVQVGQVLHKGDILVTLDPTFAQADETSLDQRISTLNLRIERLHAEIDGKTFTAGHRVPEDEARLQERIFQGRRQEYSARMKAYETAAKEHQAVLEVSARQMAARRKQLGIFEEVQGLHKDLYDRGVQSRLEMLQAENQVHSMSAEIARLQSDIEARRHELAKLDEEKKVFVNTWLHETAKDLDDAVIERDDLVQKASKAQRMHELVHLTCPIDAVVLEVGHYAPGAVAKEGEPIMRLAPLNGNLEAEVEISAADIAYVRVNDTCRIKIDTLPFQRHGTVDGLMRVVSEDAFQLQNNPEKPLVYRGRIAFTSNNLRLLPPDFRFLPGMSLTAEIKVGERKVITYFLYPLIKMFDEGLRTP